MRAAESQGLRLFIVGAQARDLLLQYVYDLPVHRATNDIDFGVIVESWDEFARLRDDLIVDKNFQPHRTMRQRLVHQSGILIDLVPFGDLEEVSGQISWPPDFSIVMSTHSRIRGTPYMIQNATRSSANSLKESMNLEGVPSPLGKTYVPVRNAVFRSLRL